MRKMDASHRPQQFRGNRTATTPRFETGEIGRVVNGDRRCGLVKVTREEME